MGLSGAEDAETNAKLMAYMREQYADIAEHLMLLSDSGMTVIYKKSQSWEFKTYFTFKTMEFKTYFIPFTNKNTTNLVASMGAAFEKGKQKVVSLCIVYIDS
jgi:hypothetical protein